MRLHRSFGELAGEHTAAEVDGDGEEEIVEGFRMSHVLIKVQQYGFNLTSKP